jgi:hypothetical protein
MTAMKTRTGSVLDGTADATAPLGEVSCSTTIPRRGAPRSPADGHGLPRGRRRHQLQAARVRKMLDYYHADRLDVGMPSRLEYD